MKTFESQPNAARPSPRAGVDNLILVVAFVASFVIYLVGDHDPRVQPYFFQLLWIIAFIPLSTVLIFMWRYRHTLTKYWPPNLLQIQITTTVIPLAVGYGMMLFGLQACAAFAGMWGNQGIGIRFVCSFGGLVIGYFMSGITSLVLIRRFMLRDRNESFGPEQLFGWWAFWLPTSVFLILLSLGLLSLS
jgi:hypothetical protein